MKALFTFDYNSWYASNAVVFPKLAKCEYSDYGPSGSVQRKDFLCVLSLNILNEKLFAFLWLYLIVLAIVQTINLVVRLVTLLSCYMRQRMILALVKPLEKKKVRRAMAKCESITEWFMLYQLGSNLNPKIFREVLREMDVANGDAEEGADDKLLREKDN
jgi:innexin